MGSIKSAIELQDNFSNVMMGIVSSVNLALSAVENLNASMDTPMDTASITAARESINQVTAEALRLGEAMSNIAGVDVTAEVNQSDIQPVEIPVTWNSDSLPVFDGTGVERFQQEIQSANNMLNNLNATQSQIAATAAQTNLFPSNMAADMNGMQTRLQAIQQRIQQIESNPLNMGSDAANAELERLRAQLDQAVQEQEMLNRAVENMDVAAANQAYLRLSQTVSGTERYLRDNVDEQGRFNQAIEQGVKSSGNLQDNFSGMVKKLLGVVSITALITKGFKFAEDCMEAFDVQNNAEIQLFSVLANNPDENLVAQYEAELTVDTSQALNDINGIQDEVDEVNVTVSARSQAVTATFDEITEKASEIQSRGIYGDEVMIAAAAEFSTYFSDTDAVTMMMDTLTDYAMGMSGGGAIDASSMVNYATNLGKIMSGSYDAMTKKGFEFTDAQKAIIEGEATREQIIAALGEEYVDMSNDMRAAAAITQVIDESWAGLYENMSGTPQGKIIQLNNAWGDLTETIGEELYPYVMQFVDIIMENWPTIEEIVSGITTALEFMINILSWVLEAALGVAEYFTNNWPQIAPIITPIATAIGLVAAAVIAYKVAMGIATVAQWLFNSAMLANPVFWIILAIVLLIAIIYGLVGAINEAQGTSMSATGIICGVVMAAVATIGNIIGAMWNFIVDVFDSIWNVVALVANFFGNVFIDPIGSICRLFFGLCDFVLSILQAIASAIDFIFGSDFAGTIQGWRDGLNGWVEDTFGSDVVEVMPKADSKDLKWDRIDTEEWFNMGVEFGEGIDKTVSDFFDFSGLNGTDDIMEELANRLGEQNGLTEDIYGNTDDILDAVEISEEDLKYLRDIAEQETVNRFTTAEIHIEQNNNNNISSTLDLDGVVDGLTDLVNEAAVIITEGVHV